MSEATKCSKCGTWTTPNSRDRTIMGLDREEIGKLSDQLRQLRLSNEEYVLIEVGTCSDANGMLATVMRGGHKETSAAVHLEDAISLARHKVDRHFEALRKKEKA